MSSQQAGLTDFEPLTARERVLQGGARYRGGQPSGTEPTGNHGGGACGNCGKTEAELDAAGKEWWRCFAPRGGPVNGCPACMNDLAQYSAPLATGRTTLDDIQGGGEH